ncbi:MAG TPA: glycoside hydrolase family 5 protein [Candidatus Dormibacteraeota bacterium]
MGATAASISVPQLLAGCTPTSSANRSPSTTAGRPHGRIRAQAGKLVDGHGTEIRLTGVNWFGLETSLFAPHGLWTRNWEDMLDQIVATGFNAIRLPFSNELLQASSVPTSIDFGKNPDLKGLTGLQLMDHVIAGASQRDLVIILDRHRPTADAQSELWYTGRISEGRWISDWTMLASRYRSQPAVIGADLHNEPHGQATWGDGNPRTDWRLAAERAGNAILEVNPDWLIVVEGIERFGNDWYWWGGNLEGARAHPIRLSHQDKLVYSAHDYGPQVYPQTWFQASDFPQNLTSVWQRHWAWLHSEQVAPVLMGEFGGRSVGPDAEGTWQRQLIQFLKTSGLSYTYWAWNPDSGDTGGILEDDWMTLDRPKLDLLATYQWPRLGSA